MSLPRTLREGYMRFRRDREAVATGRRHQLAELGQSPSALVIACCDARMSPNQIFDTMPGDLFLVRNVANLVPPYAAEGTHHGTSAAIEFAVEGLHVPQVIVLGHARCGGIEAYCRGRFAAGARDSLVGRWLSILDAAPGGVPHGEEAVTERALREMELAGIRVSLENLRGFPCVAKAEAQGRLALHGAYYDIATCGLAVLDEAAEAFVPMPAK